ncbi:MAG: hypothetical protein KDA85_12460 [Planctomycetaceae bacterium]|nr:hypothetical protein [Planctomycetaceae bacterium]
MDDGPEVSVPNDSTEPRPPRSDPVRRFYTWRVLALVLVLIWAAGQSLKDLTWLSGMMFYLPSPVVAGWLLLATILACRRRTGGIRWFAMLLLPPSLMTGLVENQWTQQTELLSAPTESSVKVVHWNVCHGVLGWEQQLLRLQAENADVLVISEPPDTWKPTDFPDHHCLALRGMLLVSRGELSASSSLIPGGVIHAFDVSCQLPQMSLRMIVADHVSSLRVHRDPFLQKLNRVIEERQPDLVVGDFNAPRRSRAFAALPAGYRHAYDVAGNGWSYTWPVPCPMLAIDQTICGPDIHVIHYELESTRFSDHRLQRLTITPTKHKD